jgi:hypothetical protein
VKEHPGRSVAIAVGTGYVLGGGLFSALTARILGAGLRMGVRLALIPLVTEILINFREQPTGQRDRPNGSNGHSSRKTSETHTERQSDHKEHS